MWPRVVVAIMLKLREPVEYSCARLIKNHFFFQMRFRLSISISEKRSKCQYGVCQYFFNSVGIFIYKINLFL